MKSIIDDIKSKLDPIMVKWVEGQCQHVDELKSQKSEYFKIKDVYERFGKIQSDGYTKKEWALTIETPKRLLEIFNKEASHKLLKVDVAVNKKLKDLEIKTVKLNRTIVGYDEFLEGYWDIETIDGKKYIFGFETYIAGGYNIQCLHVRTKYTLREIK